MFQWFHWNISFFMKQFFNFFLLGGLSTLIDILTYFILIKLNTHYTIAIVIGYTLGFLTNFILGRRYIFKAGTKINKALLELFVVFFIALVGLLLNIFIVHLLSFSIATIDPIFSRVIAIGMVFFWNFLARKYFVYH